MNWKLEAGLQLSVKPKVSRLNERIDIMEQLIAIWAQLSLQERKKFLVDESITLIGDFIKAEQEDWFFLFQKNLETLVDAMQTMAFEFDRNKQEKELKAKIKALCTDVENSDIDEDVADRLSGLSDEIRGYLNELPDEEDEQAVYERLKDAMAEEAQGD